MFRYPTFQSIDLDTVGDPATTANTIGMEMNGVTAANSARGLLVNGLTGGGNTTGGLGGNGGGGRGSNGGGAGVAGTANTGGGGGGSNGAGASGAGGNGGSGVVIIRYADTFAAATGTTGSPTITTAGGYRVYQWTSSGSITF